MNRFIFWDWNGTLLDDAETGLLAMNAILQNTISRCCAT